MYLSLPYRSLLVFAISIVFMLLLPSAAYAGSIYLSPGSRTITPGSTFSVAVRTNLGSDVVNAVEAQLSYPTDMLEFVSISSVGSAFSIDASSGGGSGGVRLSKGVIGQGISGDRLIGNVTFRAKTQGKATIGISGSLVRGADQANVFSGGAGGTYTITTKAPATTTTTQSTPRTPLLVSNVQVTEVFSDKATITWQTNRPASSLVEYGLNVKYGLIQQIDALTTNHSVTISSSLLMPGTSYHFRVKSVDAGKIEGQSADMTFKTRGVTIRLNVTDNRDNPVANKLVTLITPQGPMTATTDRNGVAIFTDVPPTQLSAIVETLGNKTIIPINVSEQASGAAPQEFSIQVQPGAVPHIDFDGNSSLLLIVWLIISVGIIIAIVLFFYFHPTRSVGIPFASSEPVIKVTTNAPVYDPQKPQQ